MAGGSDAHEAVTEDTPPLLAGRYRLQGMLGAGGMGAVYQALDLELDELVALKILTDLDPEALSGFRAEVKLARRVTHRNVARTFDIGEHEDARFLTMELATGGTLRRLLTQGRLPAARAFEIAREICEGLAAVHDQGIVHGDVKPENILLSSDGHVKVTDFGIARVSGRRDPRGSPGTPAYMAPEQLGGGGMSAQSDVFAVGCVLTEMFTGQRPWTGSPSEAAVKKLVGHAPELAPGLPAELEPLIGRCLGVAAAERPSCGELALALAAAASERDPGSAAALARASSHPLTRPASGSLRVVVCALHPDEPGDAYLGIALASDVERFLGRAPQLEVLRGPRPPGETAGADAVVEGAVRRLGTDVRITLRLVSKRDGFLLWGRTTVVALGDALAEMDAAATAVARALTAKPSARSTIALRGPAHLELYLRARSSDYDAWQDSRADNSALYERLLQSSKSDPVLLASYSLALSRAAFQGAGMYERARDAAEEALHLAPDLPEAHLAVAVALVIANDGDGAARAAIRSLELAPSLADAHFIVGELLLESGMLREGFTRIELGLRLDPRLTPAWASALRVRAMIRDDDGIAALLALTAHRTPVANDWLFWVTRMRVAIQLGGDHVAATAAALGRAGAGTDPLLGLVRSALLREIDFATTRNVVRAFHSHDASIAHVTTFAQELIAELAMHFDDLEAAEDAVCAADAASFADVTWLDRSLVARLRGRPRFDAAHARTAARARRVADTLRQCLRRD